MVDSMNGNSKSFSNWEGEGFEQMLFDYVDKGYLENIVTFFEHEPAQLCLISKMISDERLRLKIGAFAILEELKEKNNEALKSIIPSLIELLNSSEKNVRGDAAYALEIIADVTAKPALIEALTKEQDPQVKELIGDAIKKLQ